jgi:uncharacterized protein YbaP (TraB family)
MFGSTVPGYPSELLGLGGGAMGEGNPGNAVEIESRTYGNDGGTSGQTSVWKISSGNNVLYLGGTIHVLRESDYPLPEAFGSAFEKSSIVVFEAPNNESDLLQNAQFQELIALSEQIQAIIDENERIKIFTEKSVQFVAIRTPENDRLYAGFINGTRLDLTPEELIMVNEYINFMTLLRELEENEPFQLYMELNQRLMAIINEDESVKNYMAFLMNPDNEPLPKVLEEAAFKALSEKCDAFNYSLDNIRLVQQPGWLSHKSCSFSG